MHAEDASSSDPRKVTIRGGIIFNPWINVSAGFMVTLALGWMTAWFWGLWMDSIDAPAYEDQNLDIVGGFIGVVAGGLATLTLFIITIWLIFWWAKQGRKRRGAGAGISE